MSLADNPTARAGLQARLILTIRAIEDFRHEISIAQNQRPPSPASVFLAETDFHLAESQDELRRASSRIAQI
ncbi:MAG TPA: hypothetical protein VGJ87_14640 [Roseiflexaceae bacterium]|jgi:hypothetical protein